MDVTVAICTWNRAALLDRTLARLADLRVPAGVRWELLVVDNNCTDRTRNVLEAHDGKLPLRPLHEPNQGLSHARNRAVAEARGALLLWTDDDVLVHPDWLAEYLAAAEQFPRADYFGGPIRPWFEAPPPAWAARNLPRLAHCWALLDHGPSVRPLGSGEHVFGANMGFRTAALRGYPYDPNLGRVGTHLASGEETAVIDRMAAEGRTGVWVGSATVDHWVTATRVTAGYVSGIVRWQASRELAHMARKGATVFGVPRWVWRWHAAATARAWALGPFKTDGWLDAVLSRAKARGVIDACRRGAIG